MPLRCSIPERSAQSFAQLASERAELTPHFGLEELSGLLDLDDNCAISLEHNPIRTVTLVAVAKLGEDASRRKPFSQKDSDILLKDVTEGSAKTIVRALSPVQLRELVVKPDGAAAKKEAPRRDEVDDPARRVWLDVWLHDGMRQQRIETVWIEVRRWRRMLAGARPDLFVAC